MLHRDNQSAIEVAKDPVFRLRTEHIGVQHRFIEEGIIRKELSELFNGAKNQPAGMTNQGSTTSQMFTQHMAARWEYSDGLLALSQYFGKNMYKR